MSRTVVRWLSELGFLCLCLGLVIALALVPFVGALFGDYSLLSTVHGSMITFFSAGTIFIVVALCYDKDALFVFGLWLILSSVVSSVIAIGSVTIPEGSIVIRNTGTTWEIVDTGNRAVVFFKWRSGDVRVAKNTSGRFNGDITTLIPGGNQGKISFTVDYVWKSAREELMASATDTDYGADLKLAFDYALVSIRDRHFNSDRQSEQVGANEGALLRQPDGHYGA